MNEFIPTLLLWLALLGPLLLVVAAAFRLTYPVAARLLPWSALPALAATLLPDTRVVLDDAMLGGALVLDDTGRVFLLVMALLWLMTGWLVRPRLRTAGGRRLAVLLLLTMTGGLGMALAGDALLFYAATTLAGYALYGVLLSGAGMALRQAARMLAILLVVSDLLLFELLLLLGKTAAGMEFPTFRQAFLSTGNPGVMIGLLVGAAGLKMGLLGAHFWLPPVFVATAVSLRPVLVAYLLGAGLLGGLRLLPLGEIALPAVGKVLQWLAWGTLAYAALAGVFQAHGRAVIAYAAMAFAGLWLAVLSALLLYPQLWPMVAAPLAAGLIQAGFALAAVLLLGEPFDDLSSPGRGYLLAAVRWLALVLLATAPVGIAGTIADQAAASPLLGAVAVIALLAACSQVRGYRVVAVPGDVSLSSVIWPAAGLLVASLAAALTGLTGWPLAPTGKAALIALVSMLLAAMTIRPLAARLPSVPPGDLLSWLAGGAAVADRFSVRVRNRLSLGVDGGRALARRLGRALSRLPVEYLEAALTRWPVALVLSLLLGLLMAGLSGA